MGSQTVSVSQGRPAFLHDARKTKPSNADPQMEKYNKYFKVCDNLEREFNNVFKESVDEYNKVQKRADRKIENYYKDITKSDRKEKPVYEYVFQVGNMTTNPVTQIVDNLVYWGNDAKKSAEILTKFALEFESKNPQFKVVSSTLHMDEKTPHLHMAFIPIADGYKNGMKRRDSLTKALKQMGYSNNKGELAITQWQNAQKERIEELMQERSIQREYGNGRTERVAIDIYKEICAEADAELEERKEQIQVSDNRLLELDNRFQVKMRRVKELEETEKKIIDAAAVKKTEVDNLSYEVQKLSETVKNKNNEVGLLDAQIADKKAVLEEIEVKKSELVEGYNKVLRLKKLAETNNPAVEISRLKNEIKDLQEKNLKLENECNQYYDMLVESGLIRGGGRFR